VQKKKAKEKRKKENKLEKIRLKGETGGLKKAFRKGERHQPPMTNASKERTLTKSEKKVKKKRMGSRSPKRGDETGGSPTTQPSSTEELLRTVLKNRHMSGEQKNWNRSG